MSESCIDCEETPVKLPMGIFVPIRGSSTTTHSDALAQVLLGFTLPADDLAQNLMITLTGEHTSGTIRLAYQVSVLAIRKSGDTPDYSVDLGSVSSMNNQDADIEFDVVANADAGINITITDTSSDAGTINWVYQIWVLDEILLA